MRRCRRCHWASRKWTGTPRSEQLGAGALHAAGASYQLISHDAHGLAGAAGCWWARAAPPLNAVLCLCYFLQAGQGGVGGLLRGAAASPQAGKALHRMHLRWPQIAAHT